MSYTVTLNHVRYGKAKFDLAELKRRVEAAIAAGSGEARLARLLVRIIRLMAMIDAQDAGQGPKSTLNAELALFLLDFEHVQAIMAGANRPRRRLRARPRRKLLR
jgi:hypothetical protein